MNALFEAATAFERFCRARGWSLCVIGGLAVQRWGEPRQTRDIDVTILTGLGGEERFVDPLLEGFAPRIAEARRFALRHRVLLVQTKDGIPIDISLAGLPFEERVIQRSSAFFLGVEATITTCSAEDLIVLKAFADRPQDWLDIEGILVRQGSGLNWPQIRWELSALLELKDDLRPLERLTHLRERHAGPR
jgi:hypothetical protein